MHLKALRVAYLHSITPYCTGWVTIKYKHCESSFFMTYWFAESLYKLCHKMQATSTIFVMQLHFFPILGNEKLFHNMQISQFYPKRQDLEQMPSFLHIRNNHLHMLIFNCTSDVTNYHLLVVIDACVIFFK